MARVHNFNAGPAALPFAALEQAHAELLDIQTTGMSILEHSHREKTYEAIHDEAIALTRKLLGVPDNYDVLLVQGGASQQFAVIPMNLLPKGASADYVLTGTWAEKAYEEAQRVGAMLGSQVRVAASTCVEKKYNRVPAQTELQLDPNAAYLHYTSNNTIFGTQFHSSASGGLGILETASVPIVCDMSSDIMSRPIPVDRFGLIYAGAQKNIGPSGIVLVIVRKDLVASARTDIPVIFQYGTHAKNNSLYNTAPTFSIYLMRNVLRWLDAAGGLPAMATINQRKADALYAAIDADSEFFRAPVERASRSLMNIVFRLPSEELEARFISEAKKAGLVGLKGHRSTGGIRASIYNAVSENSVQALIAFMQDFRKTA